MELTGENKKQFEKWFKKQESFFELFIGQRDGVKIFNADKFDLPFEMQIGVYLAYYDSLGIYIDITQEGALEYVFYHHTIKLEEDQELMKKITTKHWLSRNEAYKEAFNQANNLVNNKP